MTDALFGVEVVESSLVPPPRPITPGEWAERYVRHKMLSSPRSRAALRDHPKKDPGMPSWTAMISTVFLLPRGLGFDRDLRGVLFPAETASKIYGLTLESLNSEFRGWEYHAHERVSMAVMNPHDADRARYIATMKVGM